MQHPIETNKYGWQKQDYPSALSRDSPNRGFCDRHLLWWDMEFTELRDIQNGHILEIATFVTDRTFEIIPGSELHIVLNVPEDSIKKDRLTSFCNTHFRKNRDRYGNQSLIDLVCKSTVKIREAEAALVHQVDAFRGTQLMTLAGSSIHKDYAYIQHHMPILASRLHYHLVDVTGIMRTACLAFPGVRKLFPVKTVTHCAMDDILSSHGLFKWLVFRMFIPFVPTAEGSVIQRLGPRTVLGDGEHYNPSVPSTEHNEKLNIEQSRPPGGLPIIDCKQLKQLMHTFRSVYQYDPEAARYHAHRRNISKLFRKARRQHQKEKSTGNTNTLEENKYENYTWDESENGNEYKDEDIDKNGDKDGDEGGSTHIPSTPISTVSEPPVSASFPSSALPTPMYNNTKNRKGLNPTAHPRSFPRPVDTSPPKEPRPPLHKGFKEKGKTFSSVSAPPPRTPIRRGGGPVWGKDHSKRHGYGKSRLKARERKFQR